MAKADNRLDDVIGSLTEEHALEIGKKILAILKRDLSKLSVDTLDATASLYREIDSFEADIHKKRMDYFTSEAGHHQTLRKAQDAYETKQLKESDARSRLALRKHQERRLKEFMNEYKEREALQYKLQALESELLEERKTASADRVKEIDSEIAQLNSKISDNKKYIDNHKDAYAKAPKDLFNFALAKIPDAKAAGDVDSMKSITRDLRDYASNLENDPRDRAKATKEADKLQVDIRMQELNDARKDRAEQRRERNLDRLAEAKWRLTTAEGIKDSLSSIAGSVIGSLNKLYDGIEGPINSFFEYQAKYEARLQGSENAYNEMMSNINKQLGLSPFVNQKKQVENLQKLIDSGVNYNVELRAYIATVSEGIASTFDAFDSNLLKLIRIQQNDSTAARLGMEAALTKMLNSMYSDTSYLSEVSDQVSVQLLDASAQLSHQDAVEVEFTAQKWLGSLYSLGVSNQAVETIASGLGYLGSGNIEQLSSNEALMSLMAMGASKGGTSISDILTTGLTGENTEKLLSGIVEYLREIATNTDANNVTKSSMAQVFGLSNTDLRSIRNLTDSDITNIADTTLTYASSLAEASNQLSQIASRTHISQMINNVIDNATTGAALTIGGNPALYGMYKALGVLSNLVGDRGLEIPGIQAMGTGTASGIDVLSVAKAGLTGFSLMGSLIAAVGNIGNGGVAGFDDWAGYEQSLARGTGIDLGAATQSGVSENVTYSGRGSSSGSDLAAASMGSSTELARENQSTEDSEELDLAKTFYEYGLIHLKTIADKITQLTESTSTASLSVHLSNQEPVKVKLDGLDDLSILGSVSTDNAGNAVQASPMLTQLRELLENLPVRISNDNFEEVLQKLMYAGVN